MQKTTGRKDYIIFQTYSENVIKINDLSNRKYTYTTQKFTLPDRLTFRKTEGITLLNILIV